MRQGKLSGLGGAITAIGIVLAASALRCACRVCRRERDLSVSGAAEPAGVRPDPARQGQRLFRRSRDRRELRGRPRRRRRCQAGGRGQRAARRHRRRRADHGSPERRAHQDRRGVRGQRLHAARGARGLRRREADRPQGQDDLGHVVSGHDLLCAARIARERRADAGRREDSVRRPSRGLGIRRHRQVRGHGRRAGLDPAGAGRPA